MTVVVDTSVPIDHLRGDMRAQTVLAGVAERAGTLANRYLGSHPGVDPVDYVIAATVERLDAELLTRNVSHFPMLSDLTAPY